MGHGATGCILVGGHSAKYGEEQQRSLFCGVVMGNGWGHIEEPIINGCIPVLILPGIDVQVCGELVVCESG